MGELDQGVLDANIYLNDDFCYLVAFLEVSLNTIKSVYFSSHHFLTSSSYVPSTLNLVVHVYQSRSLSCKDLPILD